MTDPRNDPRIQELARNLIRAHIGIAIDAADEARQTHANPVIQAAIAQAHALTAIAMLLDKLLTLAEDVVESAEVDDEDEPITERTQPLVYTVARVIGGEILH